MDTKNDLLTVDAAALLKQVSRTAIYRAVSDGRLRRAPVIGQAILIRRSELDRYQPRWGGQRERAGRPRKRQE